MKRVTLALTAAVIFSGFYILSPLAATTLAVVASAALLVLIATTMREAATLEGRPILVLVEGCPQPEPNVSDLLVS